MSARKHPLPIPPGHRWCYGCKAFLPTAAFHRAKSNPTGFSSRCKPCRKVQVAECEALAQLCIQTHYEMQEYFRQRREAAGVA